jgi:hypothetical protein
MGTQAEARRAVDRALGAVMALQDKAWGGGDRLAGTVDAADNPAEARRLGDAIMHLRAASDIVD